MKAEFDYLPGKSKTLKNLSSKHCKIIILTLWPEFQYILWLLLSDLLTAILSLISAFDFQTINSFYKIIEIPTRPTHYTAILHIDWLEIDFR